MICPPCADAADFEAQLVAAQGWVKPTGHRPETCRDAAFQSHGCTCAHGPTGSATAREDTDPHEH